jgi:PAS domain S-box-containing protein
MQNSQLAQKLKRVKLIKKDKIKIELKFAEALSSTLSTEKLITLIAKQISRIFNVERCTIFLVDEERKFLIPQASTSENIVSLWKDTPISLNSNSMTAEVIKTGKVACIENASKAKGTYQKLVRRFHIKSSLYVPMKVKGKTIGVMVIDETKEKRVFTEDEIGLAVLLAGKAAITLENTRLYDEISQEKYNLESIQNSIPDGIITYDKKGNVLNINRAATELFRLKTNILGKNRAEVFFEKESDYLDGHITQNFDRMKAFKKAAYAGEVVRGSFVFQHKNSRKYFIGAYSPRYDSRGRITGVINSFRDVTQLVKQESKIQEGLKRKAQEKERWEAVFNNVDEGIVILDNRYRIKKVNPGFEILTGCSSEETIGKRCYEVNSEYDRKGDKICTSNCPLKKLKESNEPIPYFEHKIKTKYGKEIWVGSSYSPLRGPSGKMQGIIQVMRDITKLKELDRAKSEFVSIASHELRTPLTVINGYLSMLLAGDLGEISPRHNIIFNKIYKDTQRLTHLVEDLLNVARIEENRLKIYPERVQIKSLIEEVVEELRVTAKNKRISLYLVNEGCDDYQILADRGKIKQVLTNLVDNAIKFTQEKGRVVVRVKGKGSSVAVEVEDNGTGIPKHVIPTLFQKFQQVSGSYIKENKGTGLGLFIVKNLVEMHGGSVSVDSTFDQGSTFKFVLPKAN